MKFLWIMLFSLPVLAQRAPGEVCASDVSSAVVELIQSEGSPSCFSESVTGRPTVTPFPYASLSKASVRGQSPRNAVFRDFLDNTMINFSSSEVPDQSYFWPYTDVRRRNRNHYTFNQSGNRNLPTDIRISDAGPFKRISISSTSYTLVVVCADQDYLDKCVDPVAAVSADREPLKLIPETGSGRTSSPNTSSGQ